MLNQVAMQMMLNQARASNPQLYNRVMQMLNGKDNAQARQICENVAKEKGINLPRFMRQQFGMSM